MIINYGLFRMSESLKVLINQLVYLKISPVKTSDKALSQFSGFISNCVKKEPKEIASFNPKRMGIDDFFLLILLIYLITSYVMF